MKTVFLILLFLIQANFSFALGRLNNTSLEQVKRCQDLGTDCSLTLDENGVVNLKFNIYSSETGKLVGVQEYAVKKSALQDAVNSASDVVSKIG